MDISSIFVGGTGTDVGKTHVAASLVRTLYDMGLDVGVMKPYSAGPHNAGLSLDACVLADAARIDAVPEMNPHHQSLVGPPYTGGSPPVHPERVVSTYRRLAAEHDIMVVEGMGGLLVPILPDYFMADLARDMGLRTLLVADNTVGVIHDILATLMACHYRGVHISGIVLNIIHDGYRPDLLQDILHGVSKTPVLAVIRRSKDTDHLDGADADALLGL